MFYYLRKNTGVYYVIMAGMLWSMIGIGIRLNENANVWQILLYRSSSLVLFLFIVLLINTKKNPFVLIYQSKFPVFIAAIGLFIAYSGGIYAVQNTSVANAMLLFASAPLITSILGYYFLGEKLSLYTFLAILIAFLGIFVMFMDSFGNNSINGSIGGVISAFGFSIFTVSLRWGKQNNMLPSVFLSGLLAILMTVIICKIQNHNLIIEKYDETIFIEEALHRLVEVHYHLGLESEANNYAKILGYNYNSSEWFQASYKLLNKDYEIKSSPSQKTKDRKNENFLKKIIEAIK